MKLGFLELPADERRLDIEQANKWMTRTKAAYANAVRDQIGPAVEAAVTAVLGKAARRAYVAQSIIGLLPFSDSFSDSRGRWATRWARQTPDRLTGSRLSVDL